MTSTIEVEASSPASKVTASSSDDDDDNKLDIVVAKNISIGCSGSAFTQLAGLTPLTIECGVAGVGDGRSNNSTIGGGLTLITPVSTSSSSSSSSHHRRPILSFHNGGHNAPSSSSRTRPTNPHSLNFHLRGDTPSIVGDTPSIVGDDKKEGGNNITRDDESEAVLSNNNNTSLLAGEDEAMCYLCHGTGADESGQPLRRDCACRGTDAGFVHLSCLIEYAAAKSKGWDGRLMNEFIKPWRTCPGCQQDYQNKLGIDIATEFVSFVQRQYADDTQRQVEAQYVKMCALQSMLERLQHKKEFENIANVMLSLINRMKGDVSPLPERYSHLEANAYIIHGRIAFNEGTDEGAMRAVVHLEKSLQVFEVVGFARGIASAKANIAYAKSKYKGGNNNEELMKASQELYELRFAELGEEHEDTIRAGKYYAGELQKANRREEARKLLTKLLATSKQVFGSGHNITKSVESML
jgi:hypothetical protein